jgi:transposase
VLAKAMNARRKRDRARTMQRAKQSAKAAPVTVRNCPSCGGGTHLLGECPKSPW